MLGLVSGEWRKEKNELWTGDTKPWLLVDREALGIVVIVGF